MSIFIPEMINWAKYLKFTSQTEHVHFTGVKFSTDGSLIISHSWDMPNEIILIFNATDGNILTSRSYSEGNY